MKHGRTERKWQIPTTFGRTTNIPLRLHFYSIAIIIPHTSMHFRPISFILGLVAAGAISVAAAASEASLQIWHSFDGEKVHAVN
jgi:hypothetical protein